MKSLLIILAICSTAFAQFGLRSPGFVAGTMVANEATSPSSLVTNLVAYWTLNETSGNRADSAGTNTMIEGVQHAVGYASGKIGNAADFDQVTSNTLAALDSDLLSAGTGSFTVTLWYYLRAYGADKGIVGKIGASGQNEWNVFIRNSITGMRSDVPTNCAFTSLQASSGTLSSNEWHWVAIIHDATAKTLFFTVDLSGTNSITYTTPSLCNGNRPFRLGSTDGTSSFFLGLIDEVGYWSRVLTSEELLTLYNSGNGKTYPF